MLGEIAEGDDANIRHDMAQRFRHLEHVGAPGGVVVLHDGDALAAGEPDVELRHPLALAFTFGVRRRHEAKRRRGVGVLLAGGDQHPGVARRFEQLGQPVRNSRTIRRALQPAVAAPMVLRELLGRSLLDAEIGSTVGVAVNIERGASAGVALAPRIAVAVIAFARRAAGLVVSVGGVDRVVLRAARIFRICRIRRIFN